MSIKIGVSMIVKNEEEMLPICLQTIKKADEIVIVDTGSTDKTIEKAKEVLKDHLNVQIIEGAYKWNDDFAEARNFARKYNKADWIITIDADEELLTPFEKVVEWIEKAEKENKKTVCVKMVTKSKEDFYYPRISKNDNSIKYVGRVHNYLNYDDKYLSDIQILYKYSPAHELDPGRTVRILTKVIEKDRTDVRALYYLGKELKQRKDYLKAKYFLEEALEYGKYTFYGHEIYFHLADINILLGKRNKARTYLLEALGLNLNFKEAWEKLATLLGPKNKTRCLQIAETANNDGIMFIRENENSLSLLNKQEENDGEKGKEFYDEMYKNDYSIERYRKIYKRVNEITKGRGVLDVGCGIGGLFDYCKYFVGFDISEVAVNKARKRIEKILSGESERIRKEKAMSSVWVGDCYKKENYKKNVSYYVFLEVLEHLEKDLKALSNVPSGAKIIFSVPSFEDVSHVRTFKTEQEIRKRYGNIMEIDSIERFERDEREKVWSRVVGGKHKYCIFLGKATKK